jgi:hypothetical protein
MAGLTGDSALEAAERVGFLLLCVLCSKRKALRAWKAAMKLRPPPPVDEQPNAAAGMQPGFANDQTQQEPEQEQQQQHQQQQQRSRREQVAEQFHRLYRLHGCLQQWRRCAAAGVLARRMQETDRIMAQQQAEVGQEQALLSTGKCSLASGCCFDA